VLPNLLYGDFIFLSLPALLLTAQVFPGYERKIHFKMIRMQKCQEYFAAGVSLPGLYFINYPAFQPNQCMKRVLIVCLLCTSVPSFCQKSSLFESGEYKAAYERGTRSRDGMPTEKYWQNHASYDIKADFDPSTHLITGHLSVKYFNESPDTLKSIIFKLMQNVYQKGAVRQMAVDVENLHDGIIIKNVQYEGVAIPESSVTQAGTVMTVSLPGFIKTNGYATISMDFVTPVPVTAGFRSGTVDSTSFFIAYWFPQVAVYDDIFGWDKDEYVGVPENYNDFSSYKVEISLPSQYNIWATGNHVNEKEIFSEAVLLRIEESKVSKIPVTIIDEKDFRKENGKKLTWKFEAENIPDFAWGTSDHYIWEGMSANPDPANLCWVQTAYSRGAPNFDWVLSVAKSSIELFSLEFPGVPYPYFKHITFSGTKGGGMEFPMIANNYAITDSSGTIMVTAHEIAHNYFPFMIGINERKYGWWDETMTTMMESYLHEKIYSGLKTNWFFDFKTSFPYLAPDHEILPLMTETSSMMKVMPTIINFYNKGPAMMYLLEEYLGTNQLHRLIKDFMITWAGKHPTPYDFYFFINARTGENLNWFWDACFFSNGYPDLTISKAIQNEDYITVTVKNIGGLPVPFVLTLFYEDGEKADETYNVTSWKINPEECTVRIAVDKKVQKLYLDETRFFDSNPSNNVYLIKP
jgi:hypothetical protein